MGSGFDLFGRNVPLPSAWRWPAECLKRVGEAVNMFRELGSKAFSFVLLLKLDFNISKGKRHFKRNMTPQNSVLKRG